MGSISLPLVLGRMILKKLMSVYTCGKLSSRSGDCPGAPYRFDVRKKDSSLYRFDILAGPLPANYKSLSIPLDLDTDLMDRFVFDGSGYGNDRYASGNSGPYSSIWQPCGGARIRGPVGRADIGRKLWVDAHSRLRIVKLEIVRMEGDRAYRILLHRHLHTHNIEIDFKGGKKRNRVRAVGNIRLLPPKSTSSKSKRNLATFQQSSPYEFKQLGLRGDVPMVKDYN